jgi:hypothetical protein
MKQINHFDDSRSNEMVILHDDDCMTWTGKDWAGGDHLIFQGTTLVFAYKTEENDEQSQSG